mmetsp:Transcript_682/g.988  ORF Transcript_682/g.988 Transcript_682/m.988 type:complete len:127 (-) Transcript_682:1445-1825(-)
MLKKSDAHHSLTQFIQEIGIPRNCLVDRALEERLAEWGRIISHYKTKLPTTEAESPWQNRAEAGIRECKKLIWRAMRHTDTPFCGLAHRRKSLQVGRLISPNSPTTRGTNGYGIGIKHLSQNREFF